MPNVHNRVDRPCKHTRFPGAQGLFLLAAAMILSDALPASALTPVGAEFFYDSYYSNPIDYSNGPGGPVWAFAGLYPGFLENPDTTAGTVSGDAVSSVSIGAGWSVSMWTLSSFSGTYVCANDSVDFLDFLLPGLNDHVHSFRVFNVANCEAGYAEALATPSCTVEPRPDCVGSANSVLKVNDPADTARRSVTWGWTNGSVTEFGDPVSGTTGYALCIYEGSTLKSSSVVPAGGTCGDKPCWSMASNGLNYKDASGGNSGVFKLKLRGGTGNARIGVKAGTAGLQSPLPIAADATVTVQLVKNLASGAECWGTAFAPPATKNESGKFVDTQP